MSHRLERLRHGGNRDPLKATSGLAEIRVRDLCGLHLTGRGRAAPHFEYETSVATVLRKYRGPLDHHAFT